MKFLFMIQEDDHLQPCTVAVPFFNTLRKKEVMCLQWRMK